VVETPATTRKINNLEHIHCVQDAGVAGSNPATPTHRENPTSTKLSPILDQSRELMRLGLADDFGLAI
jgi:hypothetical protein